MPVSLPADQRHGSDQCRRGGDQLRRQHHLSCACGGEDQAATGKTGVVVATEKERHKAEIARRHWKECGEVVDGQIDLREGYLLETLRTALPVVDLLLLDSECPLVW
ncbi:hypothetical protein BJX61DRAFT_149204 [Aspergillus egyptiacus]|nr:hypothetical protein BJX61DRAFT_149204 [Aspergillus egyptiacus]